MSDTLEPVQYSGETVLGSGHVTFTVVDTVSRLTLRLRSGTDTPRLYRDRTPSRPNP